MDFTSIMLDSALFPAGLLSAINLQDYLTAGLGSLPLLPEGQGRARIVLGPIKPFTSFRQIPKPGLRACR